MHVTRPKAAGTTGPTPTGTPTGTATTPGTPVHPGTAGGTRGARALVRAVGRAPLTRRAWAEAAYCLIGFTLGLVGGVLLAVALALGAGFTVSVVFAVLGALLFITGLQLARALGGVHRRLAALFLGDRTPAPEPLRPSGRLVSRLDARLWDGTGWRSAAYVLAKLPVGLLGAYAVLWWLTGLVNLTAPLRWAVFGQHPEPGSPEGMTVLTPIPFGGSPDADTFAGTFLAVAIGAVTLLCAPWVTRLVTEADRRLIGTLLGPGQLADRVRDLEETRALAVDDSVALLRRVERDLHDGAQVRLVAVAMSLDMIRQRLNEHETEGAGKGAGSGPLDVARLRQLVDGAHHNATEALTELRDLARGIHPPVLDDGLPDALATLTARSSVPVDLVTDIPERPTPAIETIAYFCAAELLANVIKHSGAGRAAITVARLDGRLLLQVGDDGHGGADAGAGSGLTGLVQRVRTVDGRMKVESPAGGPTAVTVELPLHA
ncbi:sensor domain-containing protein [Streptomyces durmitorensis]|uniref:histidine kinase n=1 Tax=Streptomyces durmitorensis TaxID=319947 RepID=A0ABY4Q5I5_9ACTN|nr:sensor histidine kinase [Streptomyces durmitorensis]UQT60426.1 sensor domain-containing protein [Streptomyces durmitorensis]